MNYHTSVPSALHRDETGENGNKSFCYKDTGQFSHQENLRSKQNHILTWGLEGDYRFKGVFWEGQSKRNATGKNPVLLRILKNEAAKSLVTFENVAGGALFLMHAGSHLQNSVYSHSASTPGNYIHTIVFILNITSSS